jgi:hypothetical protein
MVYGVIDCGIMDEIISSGTGGGDNTIETADGNGGGKIGDMCNSVGGVGGSGGAGDSGNNCRGVKGGVCCGGATKDNALVAFNKLSISTISFVKIKGRINSNNSSHVVG